MRGCAWAGANAIVTGGVLPEAEVQEARDGIRAALSFIDRLDGEARDAVRRIEERFGHAIEEATADAVMQVNRLELELMQTERRLTSLEAELRAALKDAASEKAISEMTIKDKLAAEDAAFKSRQELADISVKLAVAEERQRAAHQRMEEAEKRERDALRLA